MIGLFGWGSFRLGCEGELGVLFRWLLAGLILKWLVRLGSDREVDFCLRSPSLRYGVSSWGSGWGYSASSSWLQVGFSLFEDFRLGLSVEWVSVWTVSAGGSLIGADLYAGSSTRWPLAGGLF